MVCDDHLTGCGVFGRDEGGVSQHFAFTQKHIDILVTRWSTLVQDSGSSKPTAETVMALDLCISDTNKPMLLQNVDFLPYVVSALLLDPDHPRASMKPELKRWCQQYHSECLAQLAMYKPAKEQLVQDQSVMAALEVVAESGMTVEAQQHAATALLALRDKEQKVTTEGQKHVMLSYQVGASPCTRRYRRGLLHRVLCERYLFICMQWNNQRIVQRINENLIMRGHITWFDLTNMKGKPPVPSVYV